jgi:hypothetical protein
MGQIHLFVFCTPKLRPYISAVEVDTEATGIAGVGVNKGGTAISLYVCSTAMCFVNAHLAAHQEKTPQRNAHVLEIQRFLKVGRSTPAEARLDLSNRFGHLFFFGDLNYRIELKREEVLSLTRDRRYSELARYDQLKHQIKSGDAFAGFNEGEISFAPTFKHVPGEGVDAGDLQDPATVAGGRPYEKKKMRVPSWCDRVLWRSWPGKADGLRLLKYASAPALASSDHTPVSALFELDIEVPMMSEGQHGGRLLGHVTIELSELSASGLRPADKNGLADPYVEVYSDFSSESAKTHAQLKTLSPKWSDKISLRVPHFHSWVQYIEAAHLFFILMDHDRITADDEMGCAVVSLAGVLLPDGTPGYAPFGRKFTVPLTRHGQPAGVLTGRLFAHIQTGSSARPNKLLPFLRHPSNWFGHVGEQYSRVSSRLSMASRQSSGRKSSGSHGKGLVRAHRWDRSPTQKKAPEPVDPYAGQPSGWDEDNDSSDDTHHGSQIDDGPEAAAAAATAGRRSQAEAQDSLRAEAPAAAADAPAPLTKQKSKVTFAGDADLEA